MVSTKALDTAALFLTLLMQFFFLWPLRWLGPPPEARFCAVVVFELVMAVIVSWRVDSRRLMMGGMKLDWKKKKNEKKTPTTRVELEHIRKSIEYSHHRFWPHWIRNRRALGRVPRSAFWISGWRAYMTTSLYVLRRAWGGSPSLYLHEVPIAL